MVAFESFKREQYKIRFPGDGDEEMDPPASPSSESDSGTDSDATVNVDGTDINMENEKGLKRGLSSTSDSEGKSAQNVKKVAIATGVQGTDV